MKKINELIKKLELQYSILNIQDSEYNLSEKNLKKKIDLFLEKYPKSKEANLTYIVYDYLDNKEMSLKASIENIWIDIETYEILYRPPQWWLNLKEIRNEY